MLRFLDSFDHYHDLSPATNNIFLKWTQIFGNTGQFNPAGRNGYCWQNIGLLLKTIDMQSTWYVGFAFQVTGSSSGFGGTLYQLFNVGTNLANVVILNDGTIGLYAGNGQHLLLAQSSISIKFNQWYFLEVAITLTGSNPMGIGMECHLDGQTICSGSGASSVFDLNPTGDMHGFGTGGVIGFTLIDDVYIFDNQGAHNNNFAGDCKILAIYPNQDITTQWNGTSGGDQYKLVNETTPDGDTSYIYTNTLSAIENFRWQPLPSFVGSIIGVQYSLFARKDDEGSRVIQHLSGPTGSPNFTGPSYYLCDTYQYYSVQLDIDPNTGSPWTVSGFNNTEFGTKLES